MPYNALVVDDPAWPRDRMTAPQWHEAFEAVKCEVGLSTGHRLEDRISVVYLPPAPEAVAEVQA